MTISILARNEAKRLAILLEEGIGGLDFVHTASLLQVRRKQYTASGLLGHAQHQGIPERKTVKQVQVDGGKNVVDRRLGNVEARRVSA